MSIAWRFFTTVHTGRRIYLPKWARSHNKTVFFLLTVICCVTMLTTRHVFSANPDIRRSIHGTCFPGFAETCDAGISPVFLSVQITASPVMNKRISPRERKRKCFWFTVVGLLVRLSYPSLYLSFWLHFIYSRAFCIFLLFAKRPFKKHAISVLLFTRQMSWLKA